MWYLQSLASMMCFALMILIFKKLLAGVPPVTILVFVFGFGFLFFLAHLLITEKPISLSRKYIGALLVGALLSYLGNLLQLKAIAVAPNPGYVLAIDGTKSVVISVGAFLLFGLAVSPRAGLGMFLCVVGSALLWGEIK
jgi:drug/metabolite transporter (DMT)-like permease